LLNWKDIITVLAANSKMNALRSEMFNAFLEVETGSVKGILRMMDAVTEPTAGQAMIQRGMSDLPVSESRTQESTTVGEHGEVRVQRLVERIVHMPNGQVLHAQQEFNHVTVQQVGQDVIQNLVRHIGESFKDALRANVQMQGELRAKVQELEESDSEHQEKDKVLEENEDVFPARLSTLEAGMARGSKKQRTSSGATGASVGRR